MRIYRRPGTLMQGTGAIPCASSQRQTRRLIQVSDRSNELTMGMRFAHSSEVQRVALKTALAIHDEEKEKPRDAPQQLSPRQRQRHQPLCLGRIAARLEMLK